MNEAALAHALKTNELKDTLPVFEFEPNITEGVKRIKEC